LPQGNLLSLGLSFMRLRHEANKEKENSIDQGLEVFNVNCSSVKGRKHEFFTEEVEEPIARAAVVLLGLGSCKKSFEAGWLLIPNLSASSTRDDERVFRHILSTVLAVVAKINPYLWFQRLASWSRPMVSSVFVPWRTQRDCSPNQSQNIHLHVHVTTRFHTYSIYNQAEPFGTNISVATALAQASRPEGPGLALLWLNTHHSYV